jgi:hypothetical protein
MQQLGIRAFLHNTFLENIMEIWSIQDRISKSRLVYFVFQSLFINFLDFFGIILTGVVGSLSISILSGKDAPLFLVDFFHIIGVQDIQNPKFIVALAVSSLLFFALKSIISLFYFQKFQEI